MGVMGKSKDDGKSSSSILQKSNLTEKDASRWTNSHFSHISWFNLFFSTASKNGCHVFRWRRHETKFGDRRRKNISNEIPAQERVSESIEEMIEIDWDVSEKTHWLTTNLNRENAFLIASSSFLPFFMHVLCSALRCVAVGSHADGKRPLFTSVELFLSLEMSSLLYFLFHIPRVVSIEKERHL